jgi:hypothetical protein
MPGYVPTLSPTFFNVEDFNAVGDGVIDDTSHVQAAVDALTTAGGGVLYFPKGVYRLRKSGDLDYPTGLGPAENAAILIRGANVTLLGQGPESVIQQDGPNGWDPEFTPELERPWTVPFCFYFGSGLDTGNPLGLYPVFETGNVLVKDLLFRGNISPQQIPPQANPYAGAGALVAFAATPEAYARNIRVVNCTFEDANKGAAVSPSYIDDISFENCTFTGSRDYISGVRVHAGSPKNLEIDENEFMNLTQKTATDLWAEDYADGIPLNGGARVLLPNQANPADNGTYILDDEYNWRRATDCDDASDIEQMIRVESGKTGKGRIFQFRFASGAVSFTAGSSTPKYFYEFANVLAASTQPQVPSGTASLDGIDFVLPDAALILLKDQVNIEENGIYIYNASGPWRKLPGNRNLLVRVRTGNQAKTGGIFTGRYFKADASPQFATVSADAIMGNPVGFYPVRAATQTPVTVASATTIDSVKLVEGDLVLLTGQGTRKENGIYRFSNGTLKRALYLDDGTTYQFADLFLAGLHVTVAEGHTLAGQHFANKTPLKINIPSSNHPPPVQPDPTSIIFLRAHNFMWVTSAMTSVSIAKLAGIDLATLPGLQLTMGQTLHAGDLVLVKAQSDVSQNGVYVAQHGAWKRAAFDPGPTTTVGEFNVLSTAGGMWVRQNAPTAIYYGDPNLTVEPYRPLILSGFADGTVKVQGCTCDCDYIGCGSPWGNDGLIWIEGLGGKLVLNGNEIKNFRFEAIQTAAFVSEITGNIFFTRKLLAVVAISITPNTPPAGESARLSVTFCHNDLEGCLLMTQDQQNYALVEIDSMIVGNTARKGGHIGINHGRHVVIANNNLELTTGQAISALSSTRSLAVGRRLYGSKIAFSAVDWLKTGDRVAFWCNQPSLLPPPLLFEQFYFVKVESKTTVSIYSDAALTKPVAIGSEFPDGSLMFYGLDTVLSITGNVITGAAYPLGTIQSSIVGSPFAYGVFGQTVICNNILSTDRLAVLLAQPLAGTVAVAVSNNLICDPQGIPSALSDPFLVYAFSPVARGKVSAQWGMVPYQSMKLPPPPPTPTGNQVDTLP